MTNLHWLDPFNPSFPRSSEALTEPNGLIAAGGNLSPETLLQAYSKGIFPWFSEDEPILWWTPNPRAVLLPGDLKLSKGSQKQLKKSRFTLTSNTEFERVIRACAELREDSGTWITDDIIEAYIQLHSAGLAQSVEVWEETELVGGLYGIKLGSVFCGESMFHWRENAAKFAFCALAEKLFKSGFSMIDCQIPNPFLASLGVKETPRDIFEKRLAEGRSIETPWPTEWTLKELSLIDRSKNK